MPVAFEIRDAVVAELVAGMGSFTPAFNPIARALPIARLKDLSTLRVTVIAPLVESEPLSRHQTQETYQIEIGVQQRIEADDDDDFESKVAAVVDLAQQIADYMDRRNLTDYPTARYAGRQFVPYDADQLNEDRLATSIVTLRYIVAR